MFHQLDEECRAKGDEAPFSLIEKRNNAKSDWETKLSDVVKIAGGFIVSDNLREVSKALLKQYSVDAELFKCQQSILDMQVRLTTAEEKNDAKTVARLQQQIAQLEEKANALRSEREVLQGKLALMKDQCRQHPDFEKYESQKDEGIDLSRLTNKEMRFLRQDLQFIFQDILL